MWIRDQAFNAGKSFQKSNHWIRIKREHHIVNKWVNTLQSFCVSDALFSRLMDSVALAPVQPDSVIWRRKDCNQSFCGALRQEVINHCVWIGKIGGIGISVFLRDFEQLCRFEYKNLVSKKPPEPTFQHEVLIRLGNGLR